MIVRLQEQHAGVITDTEEKLDLGLSSAMNLGLLPPNMVLVIGVVITDEGEGGMLLSESPLQLEEHTG